MDVPDEYSKCNRQLCNLWQSADERASKYALCRQLGFSSFEARRMRDWRDEFIVKAAGYRDMAVRLATEREPATPSE